MDDMKQNQLKQEDAVTSLIAGGIIWFIIIVGILGGFTLGWLCLSLGIGIDFNFLIPLGATILTIPVFIIGRCITFGVPKA